MDLNLIWIGFGFIKIQIDFIKKYGFRFKIQSKYLDMNHLKIQINFIKNIDMDLKSIPNIWIWIWIGQITTQKQSWYFWAQLLMYNSFYLSFPSSVNSILTLYKPII